jgi:hypothetical protein
MASISLNKIPSDKLAKQNKTEKGEIKMAIGGKTFHPGHLRTLSDPDYSHHFISLIEITQEPSSKAVSHL